MNKTGFFKKTNDYSALVCGINAAEGCSAQFALDTDVFHSGFFCKYFGGSRRLIVKKKTTKRNFVTEHNKEVKISVKNTSK